MNYHNWQKPAFPFIEKRPCRLLEQFF